MLYKAYLKQTNPILNEIKESYDLDVRLLKMSIKTMFLCSKINAKIPVYYGLFLISICRMILILKSTPYSRLVYNLYSYDEQYSMHGY